MEDKPANRRLSPFGGVSYSLRILWGAVEVHRGSGPLDRDPAGMQYPNTVKSRIQFVIKFDSSPRCTLRIRWGTRGNRNVKYHHYETSGASFRALHGINRPISVQCTLSEPAA